MHKKRFFLRGILFVGILSLCICCVNSVLMPKYFYDNDWPTSSTYIGFYEMKKNTIDVIFLGSSHAVAAFSPQELYNEEGIRGYSLACEQQNMLTSYYWLKECLRYQTPKVVVLETRMLFDFFDNEVMNTTEECTRKAFDYMHWSKVKMEAVRDICNADKEQTIESYLFPNIRYHDRWENLTVNDFIFNRDSAHCELKGQAVMKWHSPGTEYEMIYEDGLKEKSEMHEFSQLYFEKIVNLCNDKNIELLLVKTPCKSSNSSKRYYTMVEYVEGKDIQYIDFNEQKLYEKINYNYEQDNADTDHVGFSGARKVTRYIGELLKEYYFIESTVDEQWEKTREYYQQLDL